MFSCAPMMLSWRALYQVLAAQSRPLAGRRIPPTWRTTNNDSRAAWSLYSFTATSAKCDEMNRFDGSRFADRLSAAAKARQAQLDKFRARPGVDDPAVLDRSAARLAVSTARDARLAERKAARQAEDAARKAALEAEQAARAARDAEAAAEQAIREVALETERKAARDARYAARKARAKR